MIKVARRIYRIALRECGVMGKNHIYLFCMLLFPILVVAFFTSMLEEGQPTELPVGIVDLDNTATTRELVHKLDAFQGSKVTTFYNSVNEARQAMQQNHIYAFLYLPKGTTEDLLAQRQPTVTLFYSNVTLLAGNLTYKDLKTITTLGSAAVGTAKLSALGKSETEIRAFLQPIAIDLHMINNPWSNYNVYLTTVMVPGILMLFMFLITAYSIGTELKFGRSKDWMRISGGNIWIALIGKLLPQFIVFFTLFLAFDWYIYDHLNFPHPGGIGAILLLTLLTVLSSQAFGVFIFGLMPSLRMSMSVCSLWAVLGFAISGATYPVFAMDTMIEGVAYLFPLRHYYMIYQICIFNGYPLSDAWVNILMLICFIALPLFTAKNIKRAMLEYVYIP